MIMTQINFMAYDKEIAKILKDGKHYSTRQIVKLVSKQRGKEANWHLVYRSLIKLFEERKLEKIEQKHIILWRLKES